MHKSEGGVEIWPIPQAVEEDLSSTGVDATQLFHILPVGSCYTHDGFSFFQVDEIISVVPEAMGGIRLLMKDLLFRLQRLDSHWLRGPVVS
jgi:hypothetical protein